MKASQKITQIWIGAVAAALACASLLSCGGARRPGSDAQAFNRAKQCLESGEWSLQTPLSVAGRAFDDHVFPAIRSPGTLTAATFDDREFLTICIIAKFEVIEIFLHREKMVAAHLVEVGGSFDRWYFADAEEMKLLAEHVAARARK